MKAVGILRGFPGLGRVVGSTEVLLKLEKKYNASIRVYTYMQGAKYLKNQNWEVVSDFSSGDISTVGIIPVSMRSEQMIEEIVEYNPDVILCDGEPVLLYTLKLRFPEKKLITILNPFDVENLHAHKSTILFFKHFNAFADLAIVHGLKRIPKPDIYNQYYTINTIIRQAVLNIKPTMSSKKIVCILGGGTVNCSESFKNNTILIGSICLELAKRLENYSFHIMCGGENILSKLKNLSPSLNVTLHQDILDPKELYEDSKLIIARGGRNTLSELLVLGIPAIIFATSCKHRGAEQWENINKVIKVCSDYFKVVSVTNDKIEDFYKKVLPLLKHISPANVDWEIGNRQLDIIFEEFLDDKAGYSKE